MDIPEGPRTAVQPLLGENVPNSLSPLFCVCRFFRTLFVQRGDAFLAYCNKLLTLLELYPHRIPCAVTLAFFRTSWTALTSGVSSSPNLCNTASNFSTRCCAAVATSSCDRRGRVSGTPGWLDCGRRPLEGSSARPCAPFLGTGPMVGAVHESVVSTNRSDPRALSTPCGPPSGSQGRKKNTESNCHLRQHAKAMCRLGR